LVEIPLAFAVGGDEVSWSSGYTLGQQSLGVIAGRKVIDSLL